MEERQQQKQNKNFILLSDWCCCYMLLLLLLLMMSFVVATVALHWWCYSRLMLVVTHTAALVLLLLLFGLFVVVVLLLWLWCGVMMDVVMYMCMHTNFVWWKKVESIRACLRWLHWIFNYRNKEHARSAKNSCLFLPWLKTVFALNKWFCSEKGIVTLKNGYSEYYSN